MKAEGFMNVDLEVRARTRAHLAPLIEQFEDVLIKMWVGRVRSFYLASYESCGPSSTASKGRPASTPSRVIHELADAIEGLDAAGRRAWNTASVRDFNVGVEPALRVWSSEYPIEADAVQRVASLRGRIVFTAYQLAALKPQRRGK